MKKLLLLMLICAYAFGSAANLEQAVRNYLEPGIVIDNAVEIPTAKGLAYIIPIDGQETLLIGEWSPDAISDEEQILALLKESTIMQANPAGAKNETISLIERINSVKADPESDCALYTGTTNLPCTDKDSCNVAAQSSPQAQVLIQADGFWQDMAAWYTAKNKLNSQLAELKAKAQTGAQDKEYADGMAGSLDGIYATMEGIDANNLMKRGIYGVGTYCPSMGWNYSAILVLENKWKGIATKLSEMPGLDARAHSFAARTKAWLDYVKTRNVDFQKMKNSLNALSAKVDAKMNEANASFVDDVGIAKAAAEFKNATAAAIKDGNDGKFRVALLREDTLASKGNAVVTQIDGYLKSINSTKKHLDTARKAVAKLWESDATKGGEYKARADEIEKSLNGKPKASELSGLDAKAKELETDALTSLAAASLGVDTGGNGTTSAGAGADGSGTAASGSATAKKAEQAAQAAKEAADSALKDAANAMAKQAQGGNGTPQGDTAGQKQDKGSPCPLAGAMIGGALSIVIAGKRD